MNVNNTTVLPATMTGYWDWKLTSPIRPRVQVDLAEPDQTLMRHLSAVELATLRPSIAPLAVDPPVDSIAIDAAMRMRVRATRGTLRPKSGRQIAFDLQHLYFPASHAARYPYRGLELLRHIDATADTHGVTIWIDTLGSDDRYCKVRLHERLAELTLASGA